MAGLIGLGDGDLTAATTLKTQSDNVRYSLAKAAGDAEGVNPILAGLTSGLKSMVDQGKSNLAEKAAMRQWAAKEAIRQAQQDKLWEREDAIREERRSQQLEDREVTMRRQDELADRKRLSDGAGLPKGARQRYLQFKPAIESAASKHGVPADKLAAILMQESSFNPRAVGDNGASVGMGQFNVKGGYGKTLMKREGLTREQLLNAPPEQQIEWAAEYFAENARYFTKNGKTDWRLAIDAYNKGAGNAGKSGVGGDPGYLRKIDRWSSALADYNADVQTSSRGTKAKEQSSGAEWQSPSKATQWYDAKDNTTREALASDVDVLGGKLEPDSYAESVWMNMTQAQKAAYTAANGIGPGAVEKLNSGQPQQSQGGLKGEPTSKKPEEKTLVQQAKEFVGLGGGEEKPKDGPRRQDYTEAQNLLVSLADIDPNFNPSEQEIKDRIEVILSRPNGLEKLRALVKKMSPAAVSDEF